MPRKIEKITDLQRELEELASHKEMPKDELCNLMSRILVLKISGSDNLTTILRCVDQVGKLQGLYVDRKKIETPDGDKPPVGSEDWAAKAREAAEARRKALKEKQA